MKLVLVLPARAMLFRVAAAYQLREVISVVAAITCTLTPFAASARALVTAGQTQPARLVLDAEYTHAFAEQSTPPTATSPGPRGKPSTTSRTWFSQHAVPSLLFTTVM